MGDYRSGFDEAFFVAFDLGQQPICAWLRTDHGKNGRRFHDAPLVRLRILQFDRFEHFCRRSFSESRCGTGARCFRAPARAARDSSTCFSKDRRRE